MTDSLASTAQTLTRGLIEFLVDITEASERDPQRDILAMPTTRESCLVQWMEEVPPEAGTLNLDAPDVIFRMKPPVAKLVPPPPEEVLPWLDNTQPWDTYTNEPRLVAPTTPPSSLQVLDEPAGPAQGIPADVAVRFDRWVNQWRQWAIEEELRERLRPVYEFLEHAAKEIQQRDDQFELVLARGLVRWITPDGKILRRHLITEQLMPVLDRKTAEVTIGRIGAQHRYEDSQLFGDVDSYHHDRGNEARDALDHVLNGLVADDYVRRLGEWVGRCLAVPVQAAAPGAHLREPGEFLEVSAGPALILRPRSKVLLAEAYKHIARELQNPATPLPVALAQLIIDTEAEQRQQWITGQRGVSGDFLGDDPRFPLEANPEQEHVMQLLRKETGVVVQGPPGTGKTHTIANLVSALLARGQRVLVTSQKDQALRVLRDKIPEELRHLCVLLTGGNKDAAVELQRGLDALSEAVASSDRAGLRRRADARQEERVQLKSRAADLNRQICDLRELENRRHPPVAPWYSSTEYQGTLGDIVRDVKRKESLFDWFPVALDTHPVGPPRLQTHELLHLRSLLLSDSEQRKARTGQWIPEAHELPSLTDFKRLADEERTAAHRAQTSETSHSRRLATVGAARLAQLRETRHEAMRLLLNLRFDDAGRWTGPEWLERAVADLFAGRNTRLWAAVAHIRDEAARIQDGLTARGVGHVVTTLEVSSENLGAARGALHAGVALRDHLVQGGKLRKRFVRPEQSNAAAFLGMVRVNGSPPSDLATIEIAVQQLEAEVAALQLVEKWADCGVEIPGGRLPAILSALADNGSLLASIYGLVELKQRVVEVTETVVPIALHSPGDLISLLDEVEAASAHVEHARVQADVEQLREFVRTTTSRPNVCPEIFALELAIGRRDALAFEYGLDAIAAARRERAEANDQVDLSRRLIESHPGLHAMLVDTAEEDVWESRLGQLRDAWAWREAQQYVAERRSAEQERRLSDQYMQLEDQIQSVTARLAADEAMLACLMRLSDDHARALRTYREHMANVGAGSGRRKHIYQGAARAAMQKAKTAVPAWVVPLPNLLENLPAERNSFDVVIVDEASQVGMEQLFLLWLAPRVIVVGDDKQCTPGESRMGKHDRVFQGLDRYLGDADPDIRTLFTAKTNLYGLLSARSGRDAVVRLKEHFRCVPEIINWSSSQFYRHNGSPGLIPLRERRTGDLDPLVTRHVRGAYTEGRNANLRNPIEAKAMADQLAACLEDPAYIGKTFGMVVLQGRGQVRLLDHEINARVSPEIREDRRIRVGVASDFQGDERDVIFLSMVVADPPRAQKATLFQQAYNVAASRAKNQLWLFTSLVMSDLKPDDLRASLLGYMQEPPSAYGASPTLDEVSDTKPCQPFESLLEQKVFREIRGRGYHVVPQYVVGSRKLDLVVVGDGARVAVECDGHRYHTSPDEVLSDARRDRELSRMKWAVIRIRESEFEFDRARELAPLWSALEARGIRPGAPTERTTKWAPVELSDEDLGSDDPETEQ